MDSRSCESRFAERKPPTLIPVVVRLVGTFDGHAHVVGLLLRQAWSASRRSCPGASERLLRPGSWATRRLRLCICRCRGSPTAPIVPALVGERGAHHKAGVTGRTAEIDQAAFGQRDHATAAVVERVAIDGTDVGRLDFVSRSPCRRRLAAPARRCRFRCRSDRCCKGSHRWACPRCVRPR